MGNLAIFSDWLSTLACLPPKDGTWHLFMYGDYLHFEILAWSCQDGEWVEPEERNTGYDDGYVRARHPLWMPVPTWMPLSRLDELPD